MNEIINIKGIDCYEKDGTAYLKLETVARGLGFTEIAASGNECVRWRTVRKYLDDLGIATSCDGGLPDFIPENVFYRLAMKAKNETAEKSAAIWLFSRPRRVSRPPCNALKLHLWDLNNLMLWQYQLRQKMVFHPFQQFVLPQTLHFQKP